MADGASRGSGEFQPRIAFAGEEFGFGYRALDAYKTARELDGLVPNGGQSPKSDKFDFEHGVQDRPLRTYDQALVSVVTGGSDIALIPYFSPVSGYDIEALHALAYQPVLMGIDQVEAGDRFCLAVYEPQVLDLVQASHPGSGLSYLMRGKNDWAHRSSWGLRSLDPGVDLLADDAAKRNRNAAPPEAQYAGLKHVDQAAQMMLRDRVDVVFAGPEATQRCKTKLDGLRAAGVQVEKTLQWVEPHREMARRVRDSLDRGRQTSTVFDPTTGTARLTSIMSAEAQTRPLYAVVLPFEVASRSPEFTIIDDNLEDALAPFTKFLVVRRITDPSLTDDTYTLTERRTNYWLKRLSYIAKVSSFELVGLRQLGRTVILMGVILCAAGAIGALKPEWLSSIIPNTFPASVDAIAFLTSKMPIIAGLTAVAALSVVLYLSGRPKNGARLMLSILPNSGPAPLGEIERVLRYFGVAYRTTHLKEDTERGKPGAVVLDIEFAAKHFHWHPFVHSVAQKALGTLFERSRYGVARIFAVLPSEGAPAIPKEKQRRWWREGLAKWHHVVLEKIEATFILLLRPVLHNLPWIVILAALAVGALYFDRPLMEALQRMFGG